MKTVIYKTKEYKEYNLKCPECDFPMILRVGPYGPFYGCQDYFFNGCPGRISARDDGTPIKIPPDSEIKKIKKDAQDKFNLLCLKINKQEAYSWLCKTLNLSRDKGIISTFSKDQCERLINSIDEYIKEINE